MIKKKKKKEEEEKGKRFRTSVRMFGGSRITHRGPRSTKSSLGLRGILGSLPPLPPLPSWILKKVENSCIYINSITACIITVKVRIPQVLQGTIVNRTKYCLSKWLNICFLSIP